VAEQERAILMISRVCGCKMIETRLISRTASKTKDERLAHQVTDEIPKMAILKERRLNL